MKKYLIVLSTIIIFIFWGGVVYADINSGLVAHYLLEGNANDSSGNNYHGTENNGVSFVDGLFGQAASFDGVDDYIILPYSETILGANPSEWSYSAWILTNDVSGNMKIITDYYSNIWDERFGISVEVWESNQIRATCRKSLPNPDTYQIYSNTVIQDGTWNLVTVVVSKPESKLKLYVNGVWENETTIDSAVDYIQAVPVRIGSNFYYGNNVAHFNGKIDEVRLYNRALSETDVQELYQQGVNLQQGLAAHYLFEGNANDSSGNNYHGTENNGVSFVDGLFGQAASFDGVDDYIILPYSETILGANPSEWSYSAWILANEDPDGMTIITDYYSNIWDERFGINLQLFETNQIRTECRKSLATKNPIYSNTVIQDGTWNLVTVVVSKPESKLKLYVNGVWENETTIDSAVDYIQAVPVRIGSNFYYGNNVAHFNGLIDDVRIYNRTLSEAEIQKLYELGVNHQPVLDPIGNKQGSEGELLEFTITATDPDEANILTFVANNLPPGASFTQIGNNSALFSWTPSHDQAGNYEDVEFVVMDDGTPMELDVELITITIGNVNRAPVFETIGPQSVSEGDILTFIVTASDPDDDNVALSADQLPEGATFSAVTGEFSWPTDYLDAGNYVVTFTATDDGDPVLTGNLEVSISVGNVENPTQLTDDLITDITDPNNGFPHNIVNSYIANLKKVNKFIEQNKITPALNQLFVFICKVEEDIANGDIDNSTGNDFIFQAENIILDLGGDPNSQVCD